MLATWRTTSDFEISTSESSRSIYDCSSEESSKGISSCWRPPSGEGQAASSPDSLLEGGSFLSGARDALVSMVLDALVWEETREW